MIIRGSVRRKNTEVFKKVIELRKKVIVIPKLEKKQGWGKINNK